MNIPYAQRLNIMFIFVTAALLDSLLDALLVQHTKHTVTNINMMLRR